MTNEKKEEKEREVDSFLRSAQESRRPHHENWENVPMRKGKRNSMFAVVLIAGLVILILIAVFAVKELKGLKGDSVDKLIDRGSGKVSSADNLKIDQGKYQS